MKLKEWLESEGRRQSWLADMLAVSRVAVHNWTIGKAKPRSRHIQRIKELSGGKVSVTDFYPETGTTEHEYERH